jgi:hypothetical protein
MILDIEEHEVQMIVNALAMANPLVVKIMKQAQEQAKDGNSDKEWRGTGGQRSAGDTTAYTAERARRAERGNSGHSDSC